MTALSPPKPSHERARDPAVILAYADQHGTAAAARQFGVNERTIRKWRTNHQPAANIPPTRTTTTPHELTTAPRPSGSARVYDAPDKTPVTFVTVQPRDVARDGVMWKCPRCGDLHHPLPGTTGEQWASTGCYLCATQPAGPAPAISPAPPITLDPARGPAPTDTALQSDKSCGPVRPMVSEQRSDPARPSAPAPVIIRQIVRVPTPVQQSGIINWARTHDLIGPGPVLALLAFAVIVLLCSL